MLTLNWHQDDAEEVWHPVPDQQRQWSRCIGCVKWHQPGVSGQAALGDHCFAPGLLLREVPPYFTVSDKVLTQTWFKVCLEFRLLQSSEQHILCPVNFLILDLQCPPQYSYRPHQMTNCPLPLADSPSVNDFLIFIIMICSWSLLCDNIHWLGSYPQYSIYYLHMVEKVLLNLLINLLWWNEMHPASG